jgi:hypothetical protein
MSSRRQRGSPGVRRYLEGDDTLVHERASELVGDLQGPEAMEVLSEGTRHLGGEARGNVIVEGLPDPEEPAPMCSARSARRPKTATPRAKCGSYVPTTWLLLKTAGRSPRLSRDGAGHRGLGSTAICCAGPGGSVLGGPAERPPFAQVEREVVDRLAVQPLE